MSVGSLHCSCGAIAGWLWDGQHQQAEVEAPAGISMSKGQEGPGEDGREEMAGER